MKIKQTKTNTKRTRGGGRGKDAAPQKAVATVHEDVGVPSAMGPLEADVFRGDTQAAAIYRRQMMAATARRAEGLENTDHPQPTHEGGFGSAALRRPASDEEEDDGGLDFRRKGGIEPMSPIEIAARLLFARQIDARPGLAEAIRRFSPVVVVEASDEAMFYSLSRCWKDIVLPEEATCLNANTTSAPAHGKYDAVYVVAKAPSKAKDVEEQNWMALRVLALAVPVLAFAPRAEGHISVEYLRAVTDRIAIPPLDASTIKWTIEIVTGRECLSPLDVDTVSRIGPKELAVAVRFDRTPAECVALLVRLVERPEGAKRKSRDLTLDELHGMDPAVAWARAAIADVAAWKRGDIDWSASGTFNVALNGPPGTGKTTFAKVFATEGGFPIVTATLAGWQSSGEGHLGHLLRAMRMDMEKARELARTHPSGVCVVFIDECDSFPNRGKLTHSHADYQIEVVNGLLEMIDGLAGKQGLIFMAACNDITRCDPALIRSGRLNPVIQINLPSLSDLEKMYRVRLGPDLIDADLAEICERTLGGAGADVERIVADARRTARQDGGRALRFDDLRAVVNANDDRPEPLRRRAAAHEAGHILVDTIHFGAAGVHATITPTQGSGGSTTRTERPKIAGTYDDYFKRLQLLLAGRTAEIMLFGETGPGHGAGGGPGSDLEQASATAVAMVASLGLAGSRPLLYLGAAERTADLLMYADVRLAANEQLKSAEVACRVLLEEHRGTLLTVAEVLLAKGRIDGLGVARLMASSNSPNGTRPGDAIDHNPRRSSAAKIAHRLAYGSEGKHGEEG